MITCEHAYRSLCASSEENEYSIADRSRVWPQNSLAARRDCVNPQILSIYGNVAHAFMFSLLTSLRPKMLKRRLSKTAPRDARGAEGALPSWRDGFLVFTCVSTQPVHFSCCILCVMALVFTCVMACPAFIWQVPQCQSRWTRGPPMSVTSFAPFLFENALSHHVHEIEMPIPSHLVAQGPQTCNICRIPCYFRMELVLPGLNPACRQEALDAESSNINPSTARCCQVGTRLVAGGLRGHTVVQDRATWEGFGPPRHLFVAKSLRPLTALNISRLGRLGDYLSGSIR